MRLIVLTAVCLFTLFIAYTQSVSTVENILSNAYTTAAKENKNVFVIFM